MIQWRHFLVPLKIYWITSTSPGKIKLPCTQSVKAANCSYLQYIYFLSESAFYNRSLVLSQSSSSVHTANAHKTHCDEKFMIKVLRVGRFVPSCLLTLHVQTTLGNQIALLHVPYLFEPITNSCVVPVSICQSHLLSLACNSNKIDKSKHSYFNYRSKQLYSRRYALFFNPDFGSHNSLCKRSEVIKSAKYK